eukprot:1183352-Prorocentrum_minimum.AAC.3
MGKSVQTPGTSNLDATMAQAQSSSEIRDHDRGDSDAEPACQRYELKPSEQMRVCFVFVDGSS